MKKTLKERMEETKLREVLPDFDNKQEWKKLSERLHPKPRRISLTGTKVAASILLIIAAGFIAVITLNRTRSHTNTVASQSESSHNWTKDMPDYSKDITPGATQEQISKVSSGNETASVNPQKNVKEPANNQTLPTEYAEATISKTKESICNGTACPLEICIIQKIVCANGVPSEVATCRTLEPDQAKQLHYKSPSGLGKDCKVTIDEIRIRRVNTGETIVLNADSQPSTAEELFNCITGQEECNLLAGIFNNDCDNQRKPHSIKVDNSYGDLIVR